MLFPLFRGIAYFIFVKIGKVTLPYCEKGGLLGNVPAILEFSLLEEEEEAC